MLPKVQLPRRPVDGHKGTFGTVLVIGGSTLVPVEQPGCAVRMFGGASLAALAALRSGCGLARLMVPMPVIDSALAIAPVCTGVPMPVDPSGAIISHLAAEVLDHQLTQCDCIVIGPALGPGTAVEQLVLRVLGQERVPVVVDADALNAMARTHGLPREVRAAAVLTPHPGEFERLAVNLGITRDATREGDREPAARALAQRLGVTVVLKGARTVVADSHDAWTLDRPNPALATGGSGDVLAGCVGGLLAQLARRKDAGDSHAGVGLFECARAAVTAHADAAARWCAITGASGGLLATDLLDHLPTSIEALRG